MRTTFPGPGARFGTKRPRLTLATTLCQPFAATFVTAARLPDWAPGRSPGCGLRPGRAELPGPRRRNSTPAACRWNRCAPPPETPGGSHQHPGCAQNSGTAHRGSGKRHSSSALSKDSACELLNALLARRASEAQGCLLRRQEICFRRIGPPLERPVPFLDPQRLLLPYLAEGSHRQGQPHRHLVRRRHPARPCRCRRPALDLRTAAASGSALAAHPGGAGRAWRPGAGR
jgi:hypothetical protein